MARWLSFFSEYNLTVYYKPGKNSILADALYRRPDYCATWHGSSIITGCRRQLKVCALRWNCPKHNNIFTIAVSANLTSHWLVAAAYTADPFYASIVRYLREPSNQLLAKLTKSARIDINRYAPDGPILTYNMDMIDSPRVVIPVADDIRDFFSSWIPRQFC